MPSTSPGAGSGDLVGTSTACIHSSRRNGTRNQRYVIMGIQDFSGDFIASNGTDDVILDLTYEGTTLIDGGTTGRFPGSTGCNPVSLDVRVTAAQLQNLPEGSYTTDGYGTHNRVIICATHDRTGVDCEDPPQEPYEDSDISITINIPAYTRLFNVGDFNLPPYDNVSPTWQQDMSFCVMSTASSAGYTLTATSDTHHASAADFAVSRAGVETIPYVLRFAPNTNPASGNLLTSGTPVGPFTGSSQNNCGGGDNASMRVEFAGADIQTVSNGNYSGVITIAVEPN